MTRQTRAARLLFAGGVGAFALAAAFVAGLFAAAETLSSALESADLADLEAGDLT